MEYINEISIDEATIHVLDSNADSPIFSQRTLLLNDDLYKFLHRHINRTARSEDLKYGIFSDDSSINKLSIELFKKNIEFVEYSKQISELLFGIQKADLTINSCDLLFVNFTTEFGRFIGIFKMDYVKNFSHNIDFIDDRLVIDIKPQISGLPNSGIRKCALIKENTLDSNYDLLYIDKPNKYEAWANYFTEEFLKCEHKNSERDITKSFIKTVENFSKNTFAENPIKARELLENTKTALLEKTVDTEVFSKNLIEDETLRDSFSDLLKKEEIPRVVEIDKTWADKKLERIRLKIDNVIDIYLDAETYHNSDKIEIVKRNDGFIDIKIKNVKNYLEK